VESFGLYVGIISGLLGIGTFIAAAIKWDLWARLKDGLYKRSNRYLIDQLQKQVNSLEEAQTRTMPAQMEAYRKELEQVDAARLNLLQEVARLHKSSEDPDNLTTTEELRQQIIALQGRLKPLGDKLEEMTLQMLESWNDIAADAGKSKTQHEKLDRQIRELQTRVQTLVVLEARYRNGISDHSPESEFIIAAADGRDIPPLPPLPSTSSEHPKLPPPPKAEDDATVTP
jgi:chromosome segregation ATPase